MSSRQISIVKLTERAILTIDKYA